MATRIAANLRRSGFIVDLGFRGKAKKRFEEAAKVKSGGRVIVATEQFSGENAAGISVRANQDHELGDTHVEAILSALAKGFTIERSWENPRAGQIDAVIEARRDELAAQMATGNLDGDRFVAVSKEYAELEPVAQAAGE
ncbi:hypothetical protein LTR94_032064, partial [Friedmanniomyces endolithicus]